MSFLAVFDGSKFNNVSCKGSFFSPSFVSESDILNQAGLSKKYNVKAGSNFLSEFVRLKGLSSLDELDGSYAFAYFDGSHVFLARDVVGLKPLWFSLGKYLYISSVRKDLDGMGLEASELDPRKVLRFDVASRKISFLGRDFFSLTPGVKDSEHVIVKKVSQLFTDSVRKRIPKKRFAVAFSGGVDSTLIAFVCKRLGLDFACYTSYFSHPGMKESEDFLCAKKVARALGFKLRCVKLGVKQTESAVKLLVKFLGPDPVKVGVALPFFSACRAAKRDGYGVIFSGLGSEELFAGYQRHKLSGDINKECLHGLLNMYERDTYRDYIVSYLSGVKVETPLLDSGLVGYSLRIPSKLKLRDGVEKFVIRKVALGLGIPSEFAFRKKRAAQYGSNFDKALGKLAKSHGFKLKKSYLESL